MSFRTLILVDRDETEQIEALTDLRDGASRRLQTTRFKLGNVVEGIHTQRSDPHDPIRRARALLTECERLVNRWTRYTQALDEVRVKKEETGDLRLAGPIRREDDA